MNPIIVAQNWYQQKTKSEKIEIALIASFLGVISICLMIVLPQGLESLGMVRFWANDDANIASYYGSLYKHLVLKPVDHIGYPFFYYYFSGFTVLPMAVLFGPTPKAVMLGWRIMNIISFLASMGFIYHLSRKYLKLNWVGLVAIFFYSTTYINLFFIPNAKPPVFETFLNLAIMVCCIKLLSHYNFKLLIISAILMGFGFSTKYHSPFLLPTFYIALLYFFISNVSTATEIKRAVTRGLIISGAFVIAMIVFYASLAYLKSLGPQLLTQYPDSQFVNRLFGGYVINHIAQTIFLGVLGSMIIFGFQGFLFWFQKNKSRGNKGKKLLQVAVAHEKLFIFLGIFGFVVLISNPYLFVYPKDALDIFFRMYQVVHDGTGWDNSGFGNPMEWFSILSSKLVFGAIIPWFLILYAILEIFVFWKKTEYRKTLMVRILLLSHILVYFGYLFTSVGLKKHHYLGPIMPEIAILLGLGVVGIIKLFKSKKIQLTLIIFFVIVSFYGVRVKADSLRFLWGFYSKKNSDQLILLAKKINENFPRESIIFSDSLEITYVLEGENVVRGSFRYGGDHFKSQIGLINPDLILITLKDNQYLLDEISDRYKLMESFQYEGYLGDGLDRVNLLEKIN